MCGICGQLNLQPNEVITENLIRTMNNTLVHRGPDDGGVWCAADGQVGLANRRLAIIDLSAAGHQPMCNEDGTIWMAYNGEVYNFKELRQQLEDKGHTFRSYTDTETIIHLYEEVGEQVVDHLRGMFAFALWDSRQRKLILARDRVGIKPLYYAVVDGKLLFASEVKAIFASKLIHPQLNRKCLSEYLAMGYVAPPNTLFQGIHKLEPGHLLLVRDGCMQIKRYWDYYDGVVPGNGRYTLEEYIEQTLNHIEESVKMRLVADVPVGVFLSGGIDSSLVAAMAARHSSQPIKTFTVGFRDRPDYNELIYARQVADYLGAEAHEVMVGPEEVKAFFPHFWQYQEEPMSNLIWFATYFVSKLARDNGVIVVLSGDGGDELYAGYNGWMPFARLHRLGWPYWQSLPKPAKHLAGKAIQPFLRNQAQKEIVRRGVEGDELFWGGTAFKPLQLSEMLVPELLVDGRLWPTLPISRWQHDFTQSWGQQSKDYTEWMAYASLKGILLEDFLMRLDKMGMAASIEGRVPLLDHHFIAHSLSIPPALKYPNYRNKHLLREVARRVLPDSIVDRRKKGFCAPVEDWLSQAFSNQLTDGLAHLQQNEGVFDGQWLNYILHQIREQQILPSTHWTLLSLGQWYQQWCNC